MNFNPRNSTLKAVYALEVDSDLPQLAVISEKPAGIIEAGQNLQLPLEIRAKGLNFLTQKIKVHITGLFKSFDCQIEAFGKGPEVMALPKKIDWGHIPVLQNLTKQIQLTNLSLIEATFSCKFQKENTVWSISSKSSKIPPSSSLMID